MLLNDAPITRVHCAANRWSMLADFCALPSTENLDKLLLHLESLMVQRMEDRRAFRSVIECIQNLERHADPEKEARFTLLGRTMLGQPQFKIRSLNAIRPKETAEVASWIQQYGPLQELAMSTRSEAGIDWRELYRKCLEEGGRTPRGGAGLGWISLARTAVKPPFMRIIHGNTGPNLFFSVDVACGS